VREGRPLSALRHAHGVAPDSVLAKSGLEMQEITRPSRDEVWDAATRGWVKRPPVEATP
jgi:hypothetical protein